MTRFIEKLRKVAETIAKGKPKLHFFGLVPHHIVPWSWDLLVSSDKLDREGMDGLRYVVARLRKHLATKDMVKISRIVILPRRKDVIKRFDNGDFSPAAIRGLYRSDPPDEVIVIWPVQHAPSIAQTA